MTPDKESIIVQRLLILVKQNEAIILELIEISNPKKLVRKPTRNQELKAMAEYNMDKYFIKQQLKKNKDNL